MASDDWEIDEKVDSFFREIHGFDASESTMVDFFSGRGTVDVYVYDRQHKSIIRSMYSAHTNQMLSYMISRSLVDVISMIDSQCSGILSRTRLPVIEYHKKAPYYHMRVNPDSWSSVRRYLLRIR